MDRLLSMRVFHRVAQLGSFSRAASEFNVSNAVASRLVADLEEHLQTRLLNRSTRNVNLTEAGCDYFKRCEAILEQIDEAESSTLGRDVTPSGRLRLLVSFTEGLCLLSHHLADFRSRYPRITLEIHLTEQIVDIVEKQYDLAIQPESFVYSNSVVARELMRARLILCATPAHLATHGIPRTPEELNGRDTITLASPRLRDSWLLHGPSGDIQVLPNQIVVSNNLIPVLGAIRSGLGIGLVFENIVQPELDNGTLVRVLPDFSGYELPYFVVYPSRKHLPAKVRVMVNYLLQLFGDQRPSLHYGSP